ncbi:hypothetical protein DVT68_01560 [Dyella solisilvae]|uniref:Uncharacterized protein n=1 Tax=Dyella solisilvae TaxID=1920168 RepID=A0A370KA93_9GAMM|nr:hypothetical protein [Dyella solisilvae]RDI99565.1 hypothetical protein DVT68_01560 [Dyella solisilvae]
MPICIGQGDDAKLILLDRYRIAPVEYSAAPARDFISCFCGAPIAQGHPFHLFRAMPRASGMQVDLCYAEATCASRLYALAGDAAIRPAWFRDPLDVLAVDRFRLMRGADELETDDAGMSPLNREASLVVTLLLRWVPPRAGSLAESLGVRLHEHPAIDLDDWDLRALNTTVNRCAASVGGDLEGLMHGLVRRFRLERMPGRLYCPLIRHALAGAHAHSYI